MGRRSDHNRDELRDLLIGHAHALLAEVGFARFSGREAAKRAGYSVGTIYNVFGSLDALIVAVNSRTFDLWADFLERRLDHAGDDRIAALVHGYFAFARAHSNLWMAIYDHRLADGAQLPDDDHARRMRLTGIVEAEVARQAGVSDIARLTRSLVAVVHGHCSFALTGSFALMGETDPIELALARVREILAAQQPR